MAPGTMRLVVVGREHLGCPLNKEVLLIGREADNDLVLDSPTVSRHHARLFLTAEGWCLKDLQSRNGTIVGGVRQEEALLAPGDEFRVGDSVLRLEPTGEIEEQDIEETVSHFTTVPFVAQTTCATCGNRMCIPHLIEEVIQKNPEADDLDKRLAETLRTEFRAEGVFLFSVREKDGHPRPRWRLRAATKRPRRRRGPRF